MRVYRDLGNIKRKEKRGRRITLSGLLVLFVGLLASCTPNWYPLSEPAPNALGQFMQQYWAIISFGALLIGFAASNIGSYYINRFAARRWPGTKQIARPDEMLEKSLKGFDNKYSLFLWSLPESEYVLVGPPGIFAFAVRSDKGVVNVEGSRWREKFSLGRVLTSFTREGLGNPGRDLLETEQKMRAVFQQAESEGKLKVDAGGVPIQGAVVFVNPGIELNAVNPDVPALLAPDVKKFIRENKGQMLSATELRELTDFLKQRASITVDSAEGE